METAFSDDSDSSRSHDFPNGEGKVKRSLKRKTLLELSELTRTDEWKSPNPIIRKLFWETYSRRLYSYRDEVSVKNDDGFYPLHLVQRDLGNNSRMYTPDFVLQALVHTYPQAAALQDLNGVFPYTYVFNEWLGEVPDQIVEAILDVDPKAWFSIYEKLRKPSILSMIAVKHPEVLKEPFNNQLTIPLHEAAKLIWFHKDIFDLVLRQGMEFNVGGTRGLGGLLIRDKRGNTPFDCVLYSSFTSQYRRKLKKRGQPTEQPVDWDWLWELLMFSCTERFGGRSAPPLHSAIKLGCSQSLIRLIMEKRPEDIRALDSKGMTPLAVAASDDDVSNSVIDALLYDHHYSYPEASLIYDHSGNLPLHIALESSRKERRWEIFRSLVESAPESIQLPNQSQMYPYMIAASNDLNSLTTIFVLLRNAPFLINTSPRQNTNQTNFT